MKVIAEQTTLEFMQRHSVSCPEILNNQNAAKYEKRSLSIHHPFLATTRIIRKHTHSVANASKEVCIAHKMGD